MMIQKGDKAPNFCLYDTGQKQVTLEDFRGDKVLLLFFPFAWSEVSTKELTEIRDHIEDYEELNVQIVGLSVDSPYTLKRFREENEIPFSLLSDFNKEVSRAYGTLYEDFIMDLRGVSRRSAFVLDGKGTVKYAEVLENDRAMPDFKKIREVLKKIDS